MAKLDGAVAIPDQRLQQSAPFQQRSGAQILSVEVHQVEADEHQALWLPAHGRA